MPTIKSWALKLHERDILITFKEKIRELLELPKNASELHIVIIKLKTISKNLTRLIALKRL